jgi:hypothetical protein
MAASRDPGAEPVVRKVKRTGGLVIAVGGLLTALAYWVLPMASVPLVGSLTATTLIEEASGSGPFGLLRFVPATAIVTVLIGLWLLLGTPSGTPPWVGAIVVLLCSALTALAYLVPLGRVDNELISSGVSDLGLRATNLTGAGFWLALAGAFVAAIGAAVQLTAVRRRG